MSLLLDARKKSQQAQTAHVGGGINSESELSLEPPSALQPGATSAASAGTSDTTPSAPTRARLAGQNLFGAKFRAPRFSPLGNYRNLLIALGIAVLFLAAGTIWYETRPSHPAVASVAQPVPATSSSQNNLSPDVASAQIASTKPDHIAQQASNNSATPHRTHKGIPAHHDKTMLVKQPDEPIDPILNSAYLAFREGKFDQSQQLYQHVLKLDERNTDALLGMAAIEQHRGSNKLAAHYYAQILALDPRNAEANAGMSALTTDDNTESRLKILLAEQPNSSSLHFALGNYYALQSRWGEAQQAYLNAYKLEPGNSELAFNLAVSFDRLGQKNSSLLYYQRAMQLDPGHHANFDNAKISKRIEELRQ